MSKDCIVTIDKTKFVWIGRKIDSILMRMTLSECRSAVDANGGTAAIHVAVHLSVRMPGGKMRCAAGQYKIRTMTNVLQCLEHGRQGRVLAAVNRF